MNLIMHKIIITIRASIYINILMINFDMHLDFDTIHSVELNIILQ